MGKEAAEMLVELGAQVYALDWAEVMVEGIKKYIHTDLSSHCSIRKDSFGTSAGESGVFLFKAGNELFVRKIPSTFYRKKNPCKCGTPRFNGYRA